MTDVEPPEPPPEPPRPRKRLTRAEKVGRTRRALLDAAMSIVGEQGHAEASVANITRTAGVALGTFYMHFESKQALLDELLPWAGHLAHEAMDASVKGAKNYAEYEIRNFDALTIFQRKHPYYSRLLSESEVATPTAYKQHIEKSIVRYLNALRAAHDRGELPLYRRDSLEAVAMMLVSIKLLLFQRFSASGDPPAWLRSSYLMFVLNALFGAPGQEMALAAPDPPAAPRRRRRDSANGAI